MKKFMSMGLVALAGLGMVASLSACNSTKTYEIALITDIGDIDDKSFNQGAWEGLKAYAEAHDISHQYYKPTEQSTTAYVDAIDLAIENGAKIVVTPGYLFEEPIYISQTAHPDVRFILLDGEPHTADYSVYHTETNVQPILYAEQQAGYLAGYAAVKDGYRDLGFMGGMAVPAVVRYGMGYAEGINAAAAELSVQTTLRYHYTGGFSATPEVQTKAGTWYHDNGVGVIFGCGGSLGQSVMAAAETYSKKVIGVDVDQHDDSPDTVITSAMKGLGTSVQQALAANYDGTWVGGTTWTLDASKDGVGLPTATASWGFSTFTLAEYNALYADLADGTKVVTVDITKGVDSEGIAEFDESLANVAITFEA